MSKPTVILGIESSCDETAAAVVVDGREVRSNVIATQIDAHARYGGVVPEIASRQHLEAVNTVLAEALDRAGATWDDLDAIAVTHQPGLVGALLVGLMAA
ncbi:MAG: tRNA (adenosine(37)-N6)-threonylcarbamoyltransferase complex transferase subunit TsaD, partial [Phycisphaerales bacterium]|nr:tRNA (adenosine(37)-N6)-threonylcarbamoyltransferase complex transferase subunit TsaD [Phycisphaerales bacterium]